MRLHWARKAPRIRQSATRSRQRGNGAHAHGGLERTTSVSSVFPIAPLRGLVFITPTPTSSADEKSAKGKGGQRLLHSKPATSPGSSGSSVFTISSHASHPLETVEKTTADIHQHNHNPDHKYFEFLIAELVATAERLDADQNPGKIRLSTATLYSAYRRKTPRTATGYTVIASPSRPAGY